ncbi:glycosyltransferase family 4 protein [Microbacterium sp.]|uniref:glycosyltransferase family 4 protein n=1 Tax=Microbacterium sp. TaxID=51671 RepID=UPI0028A7B051|nr:glycosyltransferase family 4 protein [Microbacterium sp.]
MRIALVVNNFPPRVGGLETHLHNLGRHLRLGGHEVLVLTLTDGSDFDFDDDLDVARFREFLKIGDVLGFPVPGTTRRITRMLAQWKPDVISVHTRFFPMTWLGLRIARRLRVPLIHTEHGSGHVVSDSPMIRWGSRIVDLTMGRAVLRGATRVLGVSDRVVDFVEELSGRKAEVFYNALEPTTDSAMAQGPQADAEKLKLVFVGRLVPGKGVDVFVEVVAELRRRHVELSAVVLGDGPERPRLEQALMDANLTDRVNVRGRVGSDQVRHELRGAILVNPSTLAEGFGMTLLEALDAGGRAVTYDVPGGELLASQGHPIVVVHEQNAAALASAVLHLANETDRLSPALTGWYWPERALEYSQICADAASTDAERA